MTKTEAASLMILAKINEGMSVIDAIKSVLGAANVDAMIDDLYRKLRGE